MRVLGNGGTGSDSAVICGIDWVTSTRTDADPTNDIAVANMSLAGRGTDDGNCGQTDGDAMHVAICRSVAAGVTYVVAAGNETADLAMSHPASYNEVLTVTGMADQDGQAGPWLNGCADLDHAGLNGPADRSGDLSIVQINPGLG